MHQSYLIDTNILLAFLRAGAVAQHVEAKFGLRASPIRPFICIVSVGEIMALAEKAARRSEKWGEKRMRLMSELLDELVVIDINSPEVLAAYAEIDGVTETEGQRLEKNDIWIAASARASALPLITTDGHFLRLHGRFITVHHVDEGTIPTKNV